jgi:hypothetical protein
MFDSINKVISSAFAGSDAKDDKEGFGILIQPTGATALLAFMLTIFLYLAIVSSVGMYLWNNILVKLVSGIKPAKSIWEILGLVILTQLLFN